MNLLSLKYFLAIAQYSSFTKAAERLYVTQPTLSRQISDLEEEFGVQLFNRSKRSISLTPAGQICLEEAREIVSRCDNLVERLRHMDEGATGTLRIGYLGFIEFDLLTTPLHDLSVQHPHLNVTMLRATLAELNHFLQEGKFDLIYTVAEGMDALSGVAVKKIARNPLQVVVPANHPLARRDSVRVRDLENEHFVMFERNVTPFTVDAIIQMCAQNDFSPSVMHYVRDAQTMLLMVSAGRGVAFLSSKMAGHNAGGVKFLELEDCTLDFDMVLAYRTDNQNPIIPLYLSQFSYDES